MITAMKPNPGGQLAPEEIVGRDGLIAAMWDVLSGRSIYMNDLRRIGKTMILNKMAANPPVGWVVSKRDLGGLRRAAEFATQVYRDTHSLLGKKKRALRRMNELLGALAGSEIPGSCSTRTTTGISPTIGIGCPNTTRTETTKPSRSQSSTRSPRPPPRSARRTC